MVLAHDPSIVSLDVDAPPPPELSSGEHDELPTESDDDAPEYRRSELQGFLEDGAWERAFGEWTEHTALDRTEFEIATELELFRRYDFFWDDFAGRVGFHAPGIQEDWRELDLHPELDSWGAVSNINASLTELGRIVADLLTADYVDWDEEYQEPDDLPDF